MTSSFSTFTDSTSQRIVYSIFTRSLEYSKAIHWTPLLSCRTTSGVVAGIGPGAAFGFTPFPAAPAPWVPADIVPFGPALAGVLGCELIGAVGVLCMPTKGSMGLCWGTLGSIFGCARGLFVIPCDWAACCGC